MPIASKVPPLEAIPEAPSHLFPETTAASLRLPSEITAASLRVPPASQPPHGFRRGGPSPPASGSGAPLSWASLFKGAAMTGKSNLEGKIEKIKESSTLSVKISAAEIEEARSPWKGSLYGKFLGRTPSLDLVKADMPKIWRLRSEAYVEAMRTTLASETWKIHTTICWGMRDRWLSYDGIEEFCKASNHKLVVLPMAGHHVQEDSGEELGRIISQIIS